MFYTALLVLLCGGLLTLFIGSRLRALIYTIFSFAASVLLFIFAGNIFVNGTIRHEFFPLYLEKFVFVFDGLSAFFLILLATISFLSALYSIEYMKNYEESNIPIRHHYLFFTLLVCSMLLVVTAQSSLFFLISWELMSLSSFILVMSDNTKKKTLSAALQYFVWMHFSVVFIMAGFIFLSVKSGGHTFDDYALFLSANPDLLIPVLLLFFIGFSIKAGFVPFHNWLPKAHPAAPAHISALMSGVMIKTGIYGIIRMIFITGETSSFLAYLFLIVAMITAVFGIFYAVVQKDIKKLLAYSSIENIGIIGIALSAGMLGIVYDIRLLSIIGFSAALFHTAAHALFKTLLFFCAGSVYTKTHTLNMEALGGLYRYMPYTTLLFLIGSVAISALPPFNAFITELILITGFLKGLSANLIWTTVAFAAGIAALALAGSTALICFTKAYSITFSGHIRSDNLPEHIGEVPFFMLLPGGIAALLSLLMGLFPQIIFKLVLSFLPVAQRYDSFLTAEQFIAFLTDISRLQVLFAVIIIVVYLIFRRVTDSKRKTVENAWGCGYAKSTPAMQYTASSFIAPFMSIIKPFFARRTYVNPPREFFPEAARFNEVIEDIEEFYIVKPVIKADEKFLSKFLWLQGGFTQQYILFGLLFLMLALAGAFYFR